MTHYRVVVEQDGQLSTRDFADMDVARRYADDAAAEHSETPTLAVVVGANLVLVHVGKPYFQQ